MHRLHLTPPDGHRAFGPTGTRAIVLVWVTALIAGLSLLWRHALTSGPRAAGAAVVAPSHASRFRLIVALHPMCPCSRATVGELQKIVTAFGDRVSTRVLFVTYPDCPDPSTTPLWAAAAAIPGVELQRDPAGRAARAMGALTSGQVFLYDSTGNVKFTGGITPARGHAGDNDGESAVTAILSGRPTSTTITPVFGCGL